VATEFLVRNPWQIFPFADPVSVACYIDFETAVYRGLMLKNAA